MTEEHKRWQATGQRDRAHGGGGGHQGWEKRGGKTER